MHLGLIPAHAGKTGTRARSGPYARAHPARAGKTEEGAAKTAPQPAHPRSHGENHLMTSVAASLMGSSPLMPGRRGRRFDLFPDRGLIPAHAGKTSSPASPASRRQAHPRSCRENMSASVAACCASGSSPLTRGKRQVLGRSRQVRQLIPAHAGKTLHNPAHRSASKAHPRSRGENFKDETRGVWGEGSSPLTRGKHVQERGRPDEGGLIPAHAGKTCPRIRRAWAAPAHPHSRWENS